MMRTRDGQYPSDADPRWRHLSENATGTPTYREKIVERQRGREKSRQGERFVRLGHDLTGSPAWRVLGTYARDAYAWIERRNRGNNNGKIPMSVRELAREMGVAINTAHKALHRLQLFGFIVPTVKGYMGTDFIPRKATLWRLTEHRTNAAGPTRDYLDGTSRMRSAHTTFIWRVSTRRTLRLSA
jgi:hypothetical protein